MRTQDRLITLTEVGMELGSQQSENGGQGLHWTTLQMVISSFPAHHIQVFPQTSLGLFLSSGMLPDSRLWSSFWPSCFRLLLTLLQRVFFPQMKKHERVSLKEILMRVGQLRFGVEETRGHKAAQPANIPPLASSSVGSDAALVFPT